MHPKIMALVEDMADKNNTGSIWRSCLAILRSCNDKEIGNTALKLGYQYCTENNGLDDLESFLKSLKKGDAEYNEAQKALKNAIDITKESIENPSLQERSQLWIRLERLI